VITVGASPLGRVSETRQTRGDRAAEGLVRSRRGRGESPPVAEVFAFIQNTPMSRPLYESLGFRVIEEWIYFTTPSDDRQLFTRSWLSR
jgi:hypothetical protein